MTRRLGGLRSFPGGLFLGSRRIPHLVREFVEPLRVAVCIRRDVDLPVGRESLHVGRRAVGGALVRALPVVAGGGFGSRLGPAVFLPGVRFPLDRLVDRSLQRNRMPGAVGVGVFFRQLPDIGSGVELAVEVRELPPGLSGLFMKSGIDRFFGYGFADGFQPRADSQLVAIRHGSRRDSR